MTTIRTSVNRLSDVLKTLTDEFYTKHAQTMAKRTVDRTPVASGSLRGSITLSEGSPDIVTGNQDPSGSSTKSKIDSVQLDSNKKAFVTAGEDYAGAVEYGSSSLAPAGFMRVTVSEAQEHANKAARDL